MSSIKRVLVLLTGMFLLLLACGDDDDGVSPDQVTSRLMIMAASPGSPELEILLDSVVIEENMGYLENTDYMDLENGSHLIQIRENLVNAPFVINKHINLAGNHTYSLLLGNRFDDLEVFLFRDDFPLPDPPDTLAVRCINMAPNIGAVEIRDTLDKEVLAEFRHVSYGTATDFYNIVNGDDFVLRVIDIYTDKDLIAPEHVVLNPGRVYTILINGIHDVPGAGSLGIDVIDHIDHY